MNRKPMHRIWLVAASLGLAAATSGTMASSDTPTWEEAQAASPNRLTEAERKALEDRAASGESARQAPAGTYAPDPGTVPAAGLGDERRALPASPATPAVPADPGVTPATPAKPATPAVPADKAESRDDAGARNDVAPRKRDVPVDRQRG